MLGISIGLSIYKSEIFLDYGGMGKGGSKGHGETYRNSGDTANSSYTAVTGKMSAGCILEKVGKNLMLG